MTKTNKVLLSASLVMLAAAGAILLRPRHAVLPGKSLVLLELRSIKLNDGWGYDILADKKIFIHQDVIPSIATPKRFATEAEALLTGNKVIEKLRSGKLPAITIKELQLMHIRY